MSRFYTAMLSKGMPPAAPSARRSFRCSAPLSQPALLGGVRSFADYKVPAAILMLKQGLGRLIRSASDRGILAVLDSRLVERPYGERFLESLPPARLVHEIAAVENWLG